MFLLDKSMCIPYPLITRYLLIFSTKVLPYMSIFDDENFQDLLTHLHLKESHNISWEINGWQFSD